MTRSTYLLPCCALSILMGFVGLFGAYVKAQEQIDPTICRDTLTRIESALQACREINRNWVCYGSELAEAAPVQYRFHQTNDRRPLEVLESVGTQNEQGVVVMNLHLEGENTPVKAILFGPVEAEPLDPIEHIFLLRTAEANPVCQTTPPGMVVRTPSGQVGRVNINGVDIELASTAYIAVQPNGLMSITNIEGRVTVTVLGRSYPLAVGQHLQVMAPNGIPTRVILPEPSPFFASPVAQELSESLGRVINSNDNPQRTCNGVINFNTPLVRQNLDPRQECLIRFCAVAGETVTVSMVALDPVLDPWVDLRGPDGALLAFNNDVDSENTSSRLCNIGLPVASCDYTIVARSHHNQSAGRFQLLLNRQTACQPAEPRCEIVIPFGLELRAEPDESAFTKTVLAQGAKVRPILFSFDNSWIEVSVLGTATVGWVPALPQLTECEIPTRRIVPTATPAGCVYQPHDLPAEDRAGYCQPTPVVTTIPGLPAIPVTPVPKEDPPLQGRP